jgi:hypothetical protein
MKPLSYALASALIVAVAAPALAAPPKPTHPKPAAAASTPAEHTTKGTVVKYDGTARMLTLKGAHAYKLADSIAAADFKAGDKVSVQWTMSGKTRLADQVTKN